MRVAIMQPYFLPYIGYFQLMAAVDVFVIYDNIKYTKKGWINRNRYLLNGADAVFSLPLAAASDSAMIVERQLAQDFRPEKLRDQLCQAYRKAPQFAQVAPLLEQILLYPDRRLFPFLHHSLQVLARHLGLTTRLVVSSTLPAQHGLKGEARVLDLVRVLGADTYRNPIGGTGLYDKAVFAGHGVTLEFLQARPLDYAQFGAPFVPWLSLLDVLMFNPQAVVQAWVQSHYDLV